MSAFEAGQTERMNIQQFIFTEWDPTATSDLEAIASVFDTNGDGVLDANDAAFADFKVMVTNADGTFRKTDQNRKRRQGRGKWGIQNLAA